MYSTYAETHRADNEVCNLRRMCEKLQKSD